MNTTDAIAAQIIASAARLTDEVLTHGKESIQASIAIGEQIILVEKLRSSTPPEKPLPPPAPRLSKKGKR